MSVLLQVVMVVIAMIAYAIVHAVCFVLEHGCVDVEELLRFDFVVCGMLWTVMCETLLGGSWLCAGDTVLLLFGFVNCDGFVFSELDEYCFGCLDGGVQFTFGCGTHFCFGALFVRAEIRAVLHVLFVLICDASRPFEVYVNFLICVFKVFYVHTSW